MDLVKDGETIFVEAGTTTLHLFGRELFAFVAPLTAVHKIIVDDGVSNEDVQVMKEMGLEVIVV